VDFLAKLFGGSAPAEKHVSRQQAVELPVEVLGVERFGEYADAPTSLPVRGPLFLCSLSGKGPGCLARGMVF